MTRPPSLMDSFLTPKQAADMEAKGFRVAHIPVVSHAHNDR